MNLFRVGLLAVGLLLMAQTAKAQVPFFFPGASAFTPEISIVNTGALLDSQATVSADRKYVTLNMRPQNSTLLNLRSFNFQQGATNFGNVGDPPANGNNNGAAASGKDDNSVSIVRTSPSEILARAKSDASVLHRQGMTRISSLKS